MYSQISDAELVREDLARAAARMSGVSSDRVFPFGELPDFLKEFLKMLCRPTATVVAAGLVTPEIAIAADQADLKLIEVVGDSPFTIDIDNVIQSVSSQHDVIYIANPNRVSGASLTVRDLARLAESVTEGYLVVDESLFDYSGLTALALLEDYCNVIILRSFTAPFGIYSSDAGFGITSKRLVAIMGDSMNFQSVSRTVRQTVISAIQDGGATVTRYQEIHDEALRLAVALTHLGVQCRLAATDFLLLRVSSPKDAGNFLVSNKVPVENLDGYPGMKHYLRYRVTSRESNDRLLNVFNKMPVSFVRMAGFDRRAVSLHRRRVSEGESRLERRQIPALLTAKVRERSVSTPGVEK